MDTSKTEGSTLQSLLDVLGELPGVVSDRVELLALEVRRATQALTRMVALAVIAALLLCTAWLALWTGAAYGAIQAGLPWGWALSIVILANVATAFLALRHALSLSRLVALPATVRRLTKQAPSPARQDKTHGQPHAAHAELS
jgi:hypothetical protein